MEERSSNSSLHPESIEWKPETHIRLKSGARVTIRSLSQIEEMKLVVKLQEQIWSYGLPGNAFPYPDRCLFEFAESGGLVAGAFLDDTPIAFSAAWLGRDRATGMEYLHSQLVGIVEQYRSSGIGFYMKLHQRDYARQMKIALIKWTFDPLRSHNANLNIRKLGAIIRTYVPNYYGQLISEFNKGLATDRFWAEWYVDSKRVKSLLDKDQAYTAPENDARAITRTEIDDRGFKQLVKYDLNLTDEQLLVEVPDNFDDIRVNDEDLARDWQSKFRDIFVNYLNHKKYAVTDFLIEKDGTGRKTCYKLERMLTEEV